VSLWFRLITLGIVGLVFAAALKLAQERVQGWTFYLTTAEVVFEVAVRLIFAALAGIVLGTLCTASLAPFLWHFKSSREQIAEWATKVAVVLVVFLNSRYVLTSLIKLWGANHGPRFTTALLAAHFLAFAIVLCIPRARREVVTSIDGFLGEKMTRRTAMATVAATAGLLSKLLRANSAAGTSDRVLCCFGKHFAPGSLFSATAGLRMRSIRHLFSSVLH
jgi:hypothetical protein